MQSNLVSYTLSQQIPLLETYRKVIQLIQIYNLIYLHLPILLYKLVIDFEKLLSQLLLLNLIYNP